MMNVAFIIFSASLCCLISVVLSCGGGSRSCTYTTCATRWSGWYPSVSHGSCRWQINRASHVYTTHKRNGGCPGNTNCPTQDQTRYLCKSKGLCLIEKLASSNECKTAMVICGLYFTHTDREEMLHSILLAINVLVLPRPAIYKTNSKYPLRSVFEFS